MPYAGRVEALIVVQTGGAAVSATNSVGGPSSCTPAAGSYYLTAAGGVSGLLATLQTALNAGRPSGWTVGMSTNGVVTINCSSGPYAVTFTSTPLRDLLGFAGNISSTSSPSVASKQARGVWYSDCPLRLAGDPRMAPKQTDMVTLTVPPGNAVGLVSNVMRRHRGLVWSAVPAARFREASAALVNASWETFVDDTQIGQGHAWFTPSSKVQVYYLEGSTDTLVGTDASVSGWFLPVRGVESSLVSQGWTGLHRIEIGDITTGG
jgi:hypothetical protein